MNKKALVLKVGLSPSKKNCVICFVESPLKIMKSFRSQDIQDFAMTFWSCGKKDSIRKMRLTSKFITSHLVNKQLQYTYCPISHEVKDTRK